jgi:hypothetical protein
MASGVSGAASEGSGVAPGAAVGEVSSVIRVCYHVYDTTARSTVLDIHRYEIIDWDDPAVDPDPQTNNLLHCQQADHLGAQAELIVYELFRGIWAEIQFRRSTAQYSVVGLALSSMWLVLFEDSYRRGDWL